MVGLSPVTDYFMICSAQSATQVRAIADSIEDKLAETRGILPSHKEGYTEGNWILMDYGDCVAHIRNLNVTTPSNLNSSGPMPRLKPMWKRKEKHEPEKEPASVKTIGSHRVGDVVELTAVRMNDQGVFLDAGTGNTSDDILLHKHQMTSPVSVGDKVKVQLYPMLRQEPDHGEHEASSRCGKGNGIRQRDLREQDGRICRYRRLNAASFCPIANVAMFPPISISG